jgi:predicted transcriptional regulator
VAARILEVRLAPEIQARVDELARKADEDELTHNEHAEYELLIEKADLLGIFKSMARQVLAR